MNEELETKTFSRISGREINIRKPEPRLKESKLSFKETVISIGLALGAILGTIIMVAALVGTVFIIVLALKALIRVLTS